MNAHPQESFIFVTPFLSEVERIKSSTTADFFDPQYYNRSNLLGGTAYSKTKLEDLNDLLSAGKNVVTTHATFTNATQETINALQDNAYHLILDEVVDVLVPMNDLVDSPKYRINSETAKLMVDNDIIEVDEKFRVHWTGGSRQIDRDDRHSFCEVQRYAESGNLILIDGQFFIWEFPPEVFNAMEKVTILTYLLEGSFLYPYLQIHGMEYKKASVSGTYVDGFELSPYAVDLERRAKWRQLITLRPDPKAPNLGKLSVTWYRSSVQGRPKSPETTGLKNALRRYFTEIRAAPSDVMWTCPKDCRNEIAPRGYKWTRELTDEEKHGRTQAQQDEFIDSNGLRCWVASNARATNNYSNRHSLAFMLDLNPNPEILNTSANRGDLSAAILLLLLDLSSGYGVPQSVGVNLLHYFCRRAV